MDHNPKHSKGFLTRINTTQEWEEIERKFQWQKCSSRKDASLYKLENQLTWRLVDVSWFSSLYKRCVFSRGTFLSLKLSLYLLSFLSCIDSREKAFGVFWIMIHGPSSVFIWRLVDVSWFSSLYKDASFREEHFCHWNFRSISSHSWVVLILVRKPLECFGLWSMVLLAYLSDDSLMWADFQFQTRVELFERNIFVNETFALSPLIPELYWFSWESLWSVFDYDPWSF